LAAAEGEAEAEAEAEAAAAAAAAVEGAEGVEGAVEASLTMVG
jgi:hypothetical protein